MKEFLGSLVYAIVSQLIMWGVFVFCHEFPFLDKSDAEGLAVYVGISMLVVSLALYFIYMKKIVNKKKYNSLVFDIAFFIFWFVFSYLGGAVTLKLVDMNIIHKCVGGWACFLNGILYGLFSFGLMFEAAIVIVIKLSIGIYKYLAKRKMIN